MTLLSRRLAGYAIAVLVAMFIAIGTINAQTDQQWFGGESDIAFASDLWAALLQARLAGEDAINNEPYIGIHPHGAILESSIDTITVKGVTGTVVTKHSYRGNDVSIEAVAADRAAFLEDITVMFQRESGYDTANQNWFWAKYNADGSLGATPNGIQLAGRIAKGKPKGCIACHKKAEGDDYLFVN